MSKYCLSLVCPAALEEKLMDTLLGAVPDPVFTSTPTFSWGAGPERLSHLEQVMGRSRSVQVQLLATHEQLTELLDLLRLDFKGTGLRYWAFEVSVEGVIA